MTNHNYSNALLITGDAELKKRMNEICTEKEIELRTEDSWNRNSRIAYEVVICEGSLLGQLREGSENRIVPLVRNAEEYEACAGFQKIIFGTSRQELLYALTVPSSINAKSSEVYRSRAAMERLLDEAGRTTYVLHGYNLDFDKEIYMVDGESIYLTDHEAFYLAKWLLLGQRDSHERYILYGIRKRTGDKHLFGDIAYNGVQACLTR